MAVACKGAVVKTQCHTHESQVGINNRLTGVRHRTVPRTYVVMQWRLEERGNMPSRYSGSARADKRRLSRGVSMAHALRDCC